MRIWLDMANSPHPVLFRALAGDFRSRGHELVVTTRDHGQTKELTLEVWPDAAIVGAESPGSRIGKAAAIAERVRGLRRHIAGGKPDIAVSLNSYAQVVAARVSRVPALTLMDYEFQPANHLSFRLAQRIVVPDVFPAERLRHYGARPAHVERFAGFKEELYLDSAVDSAGDGYAFVDDDRARVVFRPPAEGALYHPGANTRFDGLVRLAAKSDALQVVVLPRLKEQRVRYAEMNGASVPVTAVNGLALLSQADVFIGAGGTMCREAALLGVRSYTMFAGRLAAVDRELMRQGRLNDLRTPDFEAIDWSPRAEGAIEDAERRRRRRGTELRAWLVALVERSGGPAAT